MMTKKVDAVYEDGAFRPIENSALSLKDGTRVRLTVEQVTDAPEPDVLRLAAEVYAGLSEEDVAEIERIATERGSFFTR